jgi:deoxycytidine triphosphate deaminase
MATILNDGELKRLLGTVIVDGDPTSIRPNSYILRLGSEGEFLNASKTFSLGTTKKGIRIPPGHAVALTALETIDFRPATVERIYPGCALHALISPTTDLSREGIVASGTQVDAGYNGTLNWTISNTSNEERRFLYKERVFRLTILKLEDGEVPLRPYEGEYQDQIGYVRSRRKGAPTGMRDNEWEDSLVEGGPEALLDNLMKSGYPWHGLGQKLKSIDQQFKIVSEEYGLIHDSLQKLNVEVDALTKQGADVTRTLPQTIGAALVEQTTALQNRWMLASGSMLLGFLGLVLAFTSNEAAISFVKTYGALLGIILILSAAVVLIVVARKGPKPRLKK